MRHLTKLTLASLLLTAPAFCKVSNTTAQPIKELNTNSYQTALQESRYLILDVYSPRCGACKLLDPEFDRLNNDYGHLYTFAKLKSSPNNQTLLSSLQIEAFPTIIFYKDGKEVARQVGFSNRDNILQTAKANFPNAK